MKYFLALLLTLTSASCAAQEAEITILTQFKDVFIRDFHMQCVNTKDLQVVDVKEIDRNISAILVESMGYYCVYLVYLDLHYADPCNNSFIHHCDHHLASKYFDVDLWKYLDTIDNT